MGEEMERADESSAQVGRQREEALRQELKQIQKGTTQATSEALQEVKNLKEREESSSEKYQQIARVIEDSKTNSHTSIMAMLESKASQDEVNELSKLVHQT